MFSRDSFRRTFLWSGRAAFTIAGIGALAIGASTLRGQSSAGPGANSCGPENVTGRGSADSPIFSPGEYPVKLPPMSELGAPNNLPNPYNEGVDFGQLPEGRKWGSTASVNTAPDGTIWVVDRCGSSAIGGNLCAGANSNVDPIYQFDTSGKVLKHLGAGLFISPHKMEVDKNGHLWVADQGLDQVFELDQTGKVQLTLGKKGVAGPGNDEFDAPTDVAIAPNGDIFVSDGHTGGGTAVGNARIMKFDKEGKFILSWGKKGMGPGEFDVPHALAFDSKGRLFVADRQNDRVQIFDQNGKWIATWYQFGRPSGVYIDKSDVLYVADSESRDGRTNMGRGGLAATGYGYNLGIRRGIRIGSAKDGKVNYLVPDPCPYPYNTASDLAEGIAIDAQGNLYGADARGDVRKFTKK